MKWWRWESERRKCPCRRELSELGRGPRPGPVLGLGEGVWCVIQLEQTMQLNENSRVSSEVRVAGFGVAGALSEVSLPQWCLMPFGQQVNWQGLVLIVRYYCRNSALSQTLHFSRLPSAFGFKDSPEARSKNRKYFFWTQLPIDGTKQWLPELDFPAVPPYHSEKSS